MRVLVTGGCGFIGARLVRRLRAENRQVVVLDDLSSGRAEALAPGAELTVGCVTDSELVGRLLDGVDGVVHLAAIASVPLCQEQPERAHRVNQSAFVGLLDRVRRQSRRPAVVYASSAAVYGDTGQAEAIDEGFPTRPISNYGADKLGMELQAGAVAASFGVASTGLRFFNVYGPGQDPRSPYSGVISRFLSDLTSGRGVTVFGDGGQVRDFVHVDDVVDGVVRALDRQGEGAAVLNLCTDTETTILELAEVLGRLTGNATPPAFAPARAGDIRRSRGRYGLAAGTLGFQPSMTLEAGLKELVRSSA